MKKIIFVLVIFVLGQMHAQTGVGTTSPHPSAKLEVAYKTSFKNRLMISE